MLKTLPLNEIKVGDNRQRREFDPEKMAELTADIERVGLMHPLVLRQDNGTYHLVAGERRLRALRDLEMLGIPLRCDGQSVAPGHAPYVTMGELDELEAWEAELSENTVRTDLTWQEKAQAIESLHRLREIQALKRGEQQTVADTAEEITGHRDAIYLDVTRKNIVAAKHLEDPDIAKAKTVDEAFKLIRRKEELARVERLGIEVGRTFSKSQHTLQQGDCRELLAALPPASFDVVITDPPYGMGADEFGDSGGARLEGIHNYDDSEAYFFSLLDETLVQISRVAKPAAHLYMFCDIDKFHWLRKRLEGLLWQVFRTPLVMVKRNSGRVPFPQHGPRRQYELILYAWRGGKPVTSIQPDVFEVTSDDNLGMGAQKPVEAYLNLLKRSCVPGDTVLDPFVGTGTLFPACTALKCRATGFELDPTTYGIATKRLMEESKP